MMLTKGRPERRAAPAGGGGQSERRRGEQGRKLAGVPRPQRRATASTEACVKQPAHALVLKMHRDFHHIFVI
jgi:hypothetical protein